MDLKKWLVTLAAVLSGALALLACLVAAAAAGVWAVRTVRDELKENLDGLNEPDSTSTLPGIDEDLTIIPEEEYPEWQQPTTPAANSVANVPKAESPSASSSSPSSGAASGSGSVREPSALQGASSPASSSAAPASTQPIFGRVLNAYSGDELVYNKTLGDWRTHNGIDYACMTGSTRDRKSIVERFQNDPQCRVMLMTLKTGGVGLNLTAADTVFIFEPWWNKAAEEQAINRLHRFGQKAKVLSYSLITQQTIEEKIQLLQQQKAELFEGLIGADSSSSKHLSEDDINFILG